MTSESVSAPTPLRTMLTRTSSVVSLASASLSASTEPATSALTTRLRSCVPPSPSNSSRVRREPPWASSCRRSFSSACWARSRAMRSWSTTSKRVPASGTPERPRISTGVAGSGLLDALARVVEHRPHPAVGRAREYGIALLQRTAAEEQRRHGAAAGVAFALDHVPARRCVRIRLEVLQLGDDQDVLQQLVDALAGLGRDGHGNRLAAVGLGHQLPLGELAVAPGPCWRWGRRSCSAPRPSGPRRPWRARWPPPSGA